MVAGWELYRVSHFQVRSFGVAKAAIGGGARPQILKDMVAQGPVQWSPKGDWIALQLAGIALAHQSRWQDGPGAE